MKTWLKKLLLFFTVILFALQIPCSDASLLLRKVSSPGGCTIQTDNDSGNHGASFNGADYFGGGDGLLKATNTSLETDTNTSFTFCAWVKFDSLTGEGTQALVCKTTDINSNGYIVASSIHFGTGNDQRIQFGIGTSSGIKTVQADTFGNLSINTWYFVVAIYDADNDVLKVSINNGSFDTTASVNGAQNNNHDFQIGSDPGFVNQTLKGKLDSACFAKQVLSGTVLTSLYNGGTGKKWCQLTSAEQALFNGWWDLGEAGGSNRNDSTANANNLSEHNSPGQITGITSGVCICP